MLVHLIRKPETSPGEEESPPLVVLLHGVGSNEADLIQLAPYLDPRFLVVSARAPLTLAPGSYAWYHVNFTQAGPVIAPAEAEEARVTLLGFLDELVAKYGADPNRVYLLGFSQGAIMALGVLLTAPRTVAGVAAIAGRALPETLPMLAPPEEMRGVPVFVGHGIHDPVLPIEHARATRDLLAPLPVELTYREYEAGHTITSEMLSEVSLWLTGLLNGPLRSRPAERGE